MFYLSLGITVCGLAIYHLSLKRVPHDLNPFAFLAIGYIVYGFIAPRFVPAPTPQPVQGRAS